MNAPLRDIAVIGELLNHSFQRARRAWESRSLEGYIALARLQKEAGASFLTVNLAGTQSLQVPFQEQLEFLDRLVPALQEQVDLPLSFDSPDIEYHRRALRLYDRSRARGEAPIVNSLAASRAALDDWIALVRESDARVIVMASEGFGSDGESRPNRSPAEVHATARCFVERLVEEGGRSPGQVIVDPGLVPLAADTQGFTNQSLDAIALIAGDRHIHGVHISVGLTNFSFGLPKGIRLPLENALLTLAAHAGLDMVLGNPEKHHHILHGDDPTLRGLEKALSVGRPARGQDPEEAGYATLLAVRALYRPQ